MTTAEKNVLRSIKGRMYNHESFGTVDGPGVRYVFFLQGCPLHCLYCHNPDSIPFGGGTEWTAGQVVDTVLEYRNFIQRGGATLSGGEPLAQPEFVLAILALLKAEGIHTVLDTAGSVPIHNPKVKEAISTCDLVLLDIKSIYEEMSIAISGKGVEGALAYLEYCQQLEKPVWIRQVLLRGYTLEKTQLQALGETIQRYPCVEKVELLPFHKLGEPKWDMVSMEYQLDEVEATTQEEAAWAREILSHYHKDVQ